RLAFRIPSPMSKSESSKLAGKSATLDGVRVARIRQECRKIGSQRQIRTFFSRAIETTAESEKRTAPDRAQRGASQGFTLPCPSAYFAFAAKTCGKSS